MNPSKPKLLERLLVSISHNEVIDGLWVGSVEGEPALLRKVSDALELIKTFDRRRYARIRSDLRRVWVRLLPGDVAQFESSLQACVLDTRFVRDHSPEFIAAAIVHEATHARLYRCGFSYEPILRDRLERICINEELAFACKLPNGDKVAEWARSGLSIPPDLSDEGFNSRHLEGAIEALRHRQVPERLIKLLAKLGAIFSR
jgi:hypothetical protein